MKKVIILGLAGLMLCGCGKKEYTCNYSNTGDDYKYTSTVTFTLKDDKVADATATMKFNDKETAEKMCKIFKLSKDANDENLICKSKKIIIKDYQKSASDKDMTKDEFIDYLREQKFECE